MATNKFYQLTLASQSPRRKELLGWLDIPFEIVPSDVEEVTKETDPILVAQDLALLKGSDIWNKLSEKEEFGKSFLPFIVSSDTVVALNGKIYGKPKDQGHAREMLLELAGHTHTVVTGVSLIAHDLKTGQKRERTFSCVTKVTFDKIDEDILEFYLKTGESLDKAGSYGIQGKSLSFISHVEGSYSNVVGFPLDSFLKELKQFVGDDGKSGDWRKKFQC